MKKEKSIILSITFAICIILGFCILFNTLGFNLIYDGTGLIVDNGVYETEDTGGLTDIGWYIIIISFMLSWRLYHWFNTGNIYANLKYSSKLTWNYLFIGITTITILTEFLHSFNISSILHRIISLVIWISIGWFLFKHYSDKLDKYYKVGKYYNANEKEKKY